MSFAPEETPSTKGPAMGLAKKLCSRKPDTLSAPPSRAAAARRGRRIWRTTPAAALPLCPGPSAASTSDTLRRLLPVVRFSAASTSSPAVSSAKQSAYLLFCPQKLA